MKDGKGLCGFMLPLSILRVVGALISKLVSEFIPFFENVSNGGMHGAKIFLAVDLMVMELSRGIEVLWKSERDYSRGVTLYPKGKLASLMSFFNFYE